MAAKDKTAQPLELPNFVGDQLLEAEGSGKPGLGRKVVLLLWELLPFFYLLFFPLYLIEYLYNYFD